MIQIFSLIFATVAAFASLYTAVLYYPWLQCRKFHIIWNSDGFYVSFGMQNKSLRPIALMHIQFTINSSKTEVEHTSIRNTITRKSFELPHVLEPGMIYWFSHIFPVKASDTIDRQFFLVTSNRTFRQMLPPIFPEKPKATNHRNQVEK